MNTPINDTLAASIRGAAAAKNLAALVEGHRILFVGCSNIAVNMLCDLHGDEATLVYPSLRSIGVAEGQESEWQDNPAATWTGPVADLPTFAARAAFAYAYNACERCTDADADSLLCTIQHFVLAARRDGREVKVEIQTTTGTSRLSVARVLAFYRESRGLPVLVNGLRFTGAEGGAVVMMRRDEDGVFLYRNGVRGEGVPNCLTLRAALGLQANPRPLGFMGRWNQWAAAGAPGAFGPWEDADLSA